MNGLKNRGTPDFSVVSIKNFKNLRKTSNFFIKNAFKRLTRAQKTVKINSLSLADFGYYFVDL